MATTEFEAARAEFGEPIHLRDYHVEVYKVPPDTMRLIGEVVDTNPDGLLPTDPDPLDLHRMTLVVDARFPDLVITACEARMATYPHAECPDIVHAYGEIVGLRIGRGFTHEVRQRLGGPRGCSHITMLLHAMAPVAWQGVFAFRRDVSFPAEGSEEHRRWMEMGLQMNRNTCHLFADGGIMESRVEAGAVRLPLWARERAERLGLDLTEPDALRTRG